MDRLPHGGSWPFFGAHSLRDDAKTPAKRVALAGQPSLAQLLPCYRGVMGFWEHWRWSRLFPSWHSFILMTLLRNFTTNDERSSFKLDLVLGQSLKLDLVLGNRSERARFQTHRMSVYLVADAECMGCSGGSHVAAPTFFIGGRFFGRLRQATSREWREISTAVTNTSVSD